MYSSILYCNARGPEPGSFLLGARHACAQSICYYNSYFFILSYNYLVFLQTIYATFIKLQSSAILIKTSHTRSSHRFLQDKQHRQHIQPINKHIKK